MCSVSKSPTLSTEVKGLRHWLNLGGKEVSWTCLLRAGEGCSLGSVGDQQQKRISDEFPSSCYLIVVQRSKDLMIGGCSEGACEQQPVHRAEGCDNVPSALASGVLTGCTVTQLLWLD